MPDKNKYRILYFGTWGYGRAGLDALLDSDRIESLTVFSKWDLENPNPYLNQVYEVAVAHGLAPVNTDRKGMAKEAFWERIREAGEADLILSCCYDRFFPDHILALPRLAALNVHPSLLPAYRGVKPLENALANGEMEIGVTLHELVREMDAGDILLQRSAPIRHEETYAELYRRHCNLIRNCLGVFLRDPENYIAHKRPQDHDRQTQAPRLPFSIADEDTVLDIMRKKRACDQARTGAR